jgi:hypothetical protein
LLQRAGSIAQERKRKEAERAEAERKRQAEEAERARRGRINALSARGEAAWAEVESEIERRNPQGYERAASLLVDLKALADEKGMAPQFNRRLAQIRERHANKKRFIERLVDLTLISQP